MSAIREVVGFCFPDPSRSPSSGVDDLFPEDNYHQNRDRDRSSTRPDMQRSGSFSNRFMRPEQDDLSKGVLQLSMANAVRHYLADWVLAAVLWGSLALMNRSPGHKREFSLNDISIQHTFAEHERVPPFLLGIVSVVIPAAIILPISSLVSRSKWDVHNGLIGLFMSYTMTGVVTQLIKMSVGRPRPDLIARCLPRVGAADEVPFGLSTYSICTSTNKLRLDDGFKSFPSGHSSLSFAGLGFLALYLAGKMHLHDKRGHRTRAWVALSPLLGGIMVAVSRTMDNRHHWQDVTVGSLLGMFIAWVSYRTYYPPLRHRQCHLPLAPRAQLELTDEEQEQLDYRGGNGNGSGISNANGQEHRTRLMHDDAPRASEEETAWRRG